MEIHKPKPIHNLRDFLKEVGTIVLGVSIALAAEQAVEWWHWRNQVQVAREIIASETASNIEGAVVRLRAEACVERRLDEFAQILDRAAHSGSLPPVGSIGIPPRRTMADGAWDCVLASQVATHFSGQQLARLGRVYNAVSIWRTYNVVEVEAWGTLATMTGPGRRLDPASEEELRKAISHARTVNRNLANLSYQTLRNVGNLDLPFSETSKRQIAVARDAGLTSDKLTIQNSAPTSLICGPIGPVPSQYGHTAWPDTPPGRMEGGMKLLPNLGSK